MNHLKRTGLLLTVTFASMVVPGAWGQLVVDWLPSGVANWNVGTNWADIGAGQNVPEAQFGEAARIASGGTAQVVDTPPAVGGINITNGGVDVAAAGNLVSQAGVQGATGNVQVGAAGALSVAGSLTAPQLQSSGTLQTVGPASALTITGPLNHNGTFVAQLTAATHGALRVTDTAAVGGAFVADFAGAPVSHGSRWDILDVVSLTGGFASVSFTGTLPGDGQIGRLQQVAGGNGTLLQLEIEQRLVLHVDRETRIVAITNPSTSPISFDLDGYAIASAVGSLGPAGWNSLDDQGVSGGTWFETGSGGTPNGLAELNPSSFTTLAPSAALALGTIYAPNFVQFGQETEDYVFTYNTANGETRDGVVKYTGDKQFNNVVLTVDPDSGEATMRNESQLPISFDGYTIGSASGSLLVSGWNSLEDQGAVGGAWLEANPTEFRVSEVMTQCCTTLTVNQGFNLGTLFDTAGARDLVFEFLIAGQAVPFLGEVVYGPIGSLVTGDFDGDGLWNCADIDALVGEIVAGTHNPAFDMNGDGLVNRADITEGGTGWLAVGGANNAGSTGGNAFLEGDANLDGSVDVSDFNLWNSAKFTNAAEWCRGDFNADGSVDVSDFNLWNSKKFTSSSGGLSAVPEPVAAPWLLGSVLACGLGQRRRARTPRER